MFPLPSSILPSVSDPVVEIWVKLLSGFNTKYSGSIDIFFIHCDSCIMTMKSLLKVPLDSIRYKNSNYPECKHFFHFHFWGKFCKSVLFHNVRLIVAIF